MVYQQTNHELVAVNGTTGATVFVMRTSSQVGTRYKFSEPTVENGESKQLLRMPYATLHESKQPLRMPYATLHESKQPLRIPYDILHLLPGTV